MLKKILAEMPKADVEIPVISGDVVRQLGIMSQWRDKLLEAQCKLLAEQGWRKLRTWEEVDSKLVDMFGWEVNTKETRDFYNWLEV